MVDYRYRIVVSKSLDNSFEKNKKTKTKDSFSLSHISGLVLTSWFWSLRNIVPGKALDCLKSGIFYFYSIGMMSVNKYLSKPPWNHFFNTDQIVKTFQKS